jgi:hypothetical protein
MGGWVVVGVSHTMKISADAEREAAGLLTSQCLKNCFSSQTKLLYD